MKSRKTLAITILFLLVATALSASAGTVNLQFNSTGPYSYGFPTYPYYFTVNGTTPESLMCIGYIEHITYGERWQATEMSVAAYGAMIGDPVKAEQLAYLFTLAVADGGANSSVNAEAWFINEGQPAPEPDAALLAGFTPGPYSNVVVYVPTSDQTGWTDGVPQTFLGSTPEPSTFLTLGSGLIGLAGLARKRLFS
jgi:PEP-CTERM motif-containing protein